MSDPPSDTSFQTRRLAPARRLSVLSVFAIIISTLPCPPLSLLGAVLGLIALNRIRNSGGRIYGATLARVAVIVGLLITLLGAYLTVVFQEEMEAWQQRSISTAVFSFLAEAQNGNATGAMTKWDHQEAPITVKEVQKFGADMESQLGRMISVQVGTVAPMPGGSLLQPPLDAWLILDFESGQVNGNARVRIEKSGMLKLRARLQQLVIGNDLTDDLWLPANLNRDPPTNTESE